jgi:hypothetical protein
MCSFAKVSTVFALFPVISAPLMLVSVVARLLATARAMKRQRVPRVRVTARAARSRRAQRDAPVFQQGG